MDWFVDLIQLIDKFTGIGENYSYLIAGAGILFMLMAAIMKIGQLIKNI